MLEPLAGSHWDNCKVIFARRTAFRFALVSLADGHRAERILSCYAHALFVCHGFAVDRAASTGKLIFFNLSSTVTKATQLLAQDGLTREERMARWYRHHLRNNSRAADSETMITNLAELREKIAASLGVSGSARAAAPHNIAPKTEDFHYVKV